MILPGCVGAGDGVVWPTPGVIYGDGVVDGAFGLYVGACVPGLNGIYGVGFWETHTTDWQQKSLGSWVREHWGGSAAGKLPHLKYNFFNYYLGLNIDRHNKFHFLKKKLYNILQH